MAKLQYRYTKMVSKVGLTYEKALETLVEISEKEFRQAFQQNLKNIDWSYFFGTSSNASLSFTLNGFFYDCHIEVVEE